MSFVFIAPFGETFTPSSSGAIATVIWEHCRQAKRSAIEPFVIATQSDAPPFAWPRTILLPHPPRPQNALTLVAARAQRKWQGWSNLNYRPWADGIVSALKKQDLQNLPIVINNDPELAVFLKSQFSDAFIVHYFHSVMECKPAAQRDFKNAVSLALGVSNFTSRWAEEYYNMPPNSIRTVYNGVDTAQFYPPSTPAPAPLVVNYVGRLGIEKAPDLLLRAALEIAGDVAPFSIQIAGSNAGPRYELDEYQQELHAMADELRKRGVQVSFAGHIGREEVPKALRRAHINVMPSRCQEAFGMATLEGMACGLATIASRTGGTQEVLGDTGLLFERDDVPGLAAHLKTLLNDETLRQEYSGKGPERASELTWEHAWAQLSKILLDGHCDLPEPAAHV